MANIKNIDGFRRCYLCKWVRPATVEHFPRDKNRPLGLGYQCRPCAKIETKIRSKPRPKRWSDMTDVQKHNKREWQRVYAKGEGHSKYRLGSYKHYDKKKGLGFDLTLDWFLENIYNKPCFYCEEVGKSGCDRIDNSIGHIMSNVVPCCDMCNTTRMDNFTHDEMIKIGKTIKLIKTNRWLNGSQTQNASSPSYQCTDLPIEHLGS